MQTPSATLFCVTDDAALAAESRQRTDAGTGHLRVRVVPPERLASPAAAAYLADVAGGGPYALLADPGGVDAVLALAAGMAAPYPAVALFLTATAPVGDGRAYPSHPVPVVGLAGRHDPTAPPDAMAGWSRHFGWRFRLIVLEGGAGFLHTDAAAVVAAIETEMWIRPIATPAMADWPRAERALAAMRA
jgi:hypothetical protein